MGRLEGMTPIKSKMRWTLIMRSIYLNDRVTMITLTWRKRTKMRRRPTLGISLIFPIPSMIKVRSTSSSPVNIDKYTCAILTRFMFYFYSHIF